MNPKPLDPTISASAVGRGETASAFETGGAGAPAFEPRRLGFLAPAQQADEIGRLGRYRVLGVLGHGGMGLVFRAEDPALRRLVALKVMLPRFASNPQARARFIREARAQAAVEHENIIPIHDIVEDHEPPFITMPLLRGMTLGDALRANPRPPLAAILRLGREMADGLAAAHETGLVHRDIKPGNIWLEPTRKPGEYRVKILDFGLARAASEADPIATSSEPLTADGAVVGTPMYMSPEQARGEPLDARTDLFSLGSVLYQMAAGDLPFSGTSTASVLLAVVSHEPKGLEKQSVPPALKSLIERLLTKDAAMRPASAAAIAEELRQIELGLAAAAPVQVVALDSILTAAPPAANPWNSLESTEASKVEPAKVPARAKSNTKLWIAAGVAGLALVAGLTALMFKMMKNGPAVVKENEPPKPTPKEQPKAKADADRKAAEMLREEARFYVKVPSGDHRFIELGEALPAEPFVVENIEFPHKSDAPKLTGYMSSTLLPAVAELRSLRRILDLNGRLPVSEAELSKLVASPSGMSLHAIRLAACELSDRNIESLKLPPELDSVWLDARNADDRQVQRLSELKLVRSVGLQNLGHSPGLTEKGLLELTRLPITGLYLVDSKRLGIEFVKRVAEISNLEILKINLPDSAALREVTRSNSIRVLELSDQLRDSDLVDFEKMNSLRELLVPSNPALTKPALEKLSAALPLCKIVSAHGTFGPKPTADRKAAEMLQPHADLQLKLASGKSALVPKGEPLPAESFDIDQIYVWSEAPADIAHTVLLPAVSGLRSLTRLDSTPLVPMTPNQILSLLAFPTGGTLRELQLGFQLSPQVVEALAKLPNLTATRCRAGEVDDDCLERLTTLKAMKWFHLHELGRSGKVTDRGLKVLAGLPLDSLGLTDSPAAVRFLQLLPANTHLREVKLWGAGVEDEHLALLVKCKNLDKVNLVATKVTDAGLPQLAKHQGLREINLKKTAVTPEGAKSLSDSLPMCAILHDSGTFGPVK